MHSFHLPASSVELPENAITATSFLNLALFHRDMSTATKLLSFWSPEKRPEDPLLPLSFNALLTSSTSVPSAEDVEFFRLLLDRGLDLNCDTSPASPLSRLGFSGESFFAKLAAEKSVPMMRVALDPKYSAIVDKGEDTRGTALAQAAVDGDTEMMGLLLGAGADASWRSLEGRRASLVMFVMHWLQSPQLLSPEKQAGLANGRGVEVLAKLLHRGKPEESIVEEALNEFKQTLTVDGKAGLFLLQRCLDGKTFCCDFCGTIKRKDGDKTKRLDMCACKSVAYCCKQHQLDAWKAHRGTCGGALDEDGMAKAIVRKSGGKRGGGEKGKK